MIKFIQVFICIFASFLAGISYGAEPIVMNIGVVKMSVLNDPPLSRLDLPVDNLGFAGAILGQEDNATTGKFLGQEFALTQISSTQDSIMEDLINLDQSDIQLVVWLGDGADLSVAAMRFPDILFLNATARDNVLRGAQCQPNILHIAPSQNMIADAITQYAVVKNWKKWFLVYGSHDSDLELYNSYKNSTKKFGIEIVEEREFTDVSGARRTDTGHVLVQKQIPTFTQTNKDYDLMVAADAQDVFAAYLPYHTWLARPVIGSAGLRALTWTPAHEAWGATQIQRRFERSFQRFMREEDYQAWLAMRVIGEAFTRTHNTNVTALRDYMISEAFEVAAFKGVKLNFRHWNGQLRQPILLADERMLASVSPQEGYLHRVNQLDTLGIDQPENQCKEFADAN